MSQNATPAQGAANLDDHSNFTGALLDCLAQGIITINPSRLIIAWNEAAEKLTGVRARDVLNRSISSLPPSLQAVIDETFVTGRPVVRRQVLLSPVGGVEDMLQITTSIAHLPCGNLLSVMAELQSVTQAQAMASNLERLDRLSNLGVLSAGVAHEIKNALVAIRTFVDLAAEKFEDTELTSLVSQEIRRIDALVRQNLRGAKREEFHLAPVGLHALITDSTNLLRHLSEKRGVKLSLDLGAARDQINGDERQLRHAIVNLLMNALDATPESGQIQIATDTIEVWERPHLRLNISDTGSGIRPEDLPRMFSPFFTTKSDGTGLGLAITRRIIQEHQGAITVDSKSGQGTTFHIFLPLF